MDFSFNGNDDNYDFVEIDYDINDEVNDLSVDNVEKQAFGEGVARGKKIYRHKNTTTSKLK